MICPHCEANLQPPPAYWQTRASPWNCSYCGKLYGISNNQQVFSISDHFRPLGPLLPYAIAKRWCYYSTPGHYVYALCYPSGIPFYVGLGQKNRAVSHVVSAQRYSCGSGNLGLKDQEIAYLSDTGLGVWFHFITLTFDRKTACASESYWIQHFGLRSQGGMLTNDVQPTAYPADQAIDCDILTEERSGDPQIRVFEHPDFAVCIPENSLRSNGFTPTVAIDCAACGASSFADESMRGQHLICPRCGHYIYGQDFRERFPLKQFDTRFST